MLILFDQGTPVAIKNVLKEYTVVTARERGWSTLLNGELLPVADEAGFDVLVTTDAGMPHQQKLKNRKLAVVVLTEARWELIRLMLPQIATAIASARPGTFSIVEIPRS